MCFILKVLSQQTNNFAENNKISKMLFIAVLSSRLSLLITVGLQYFSHGPTLNVKCYKFLPTYQNQTRILKQNSSGQHYVKTTAYCMTNFQVNILSYIQDCVKSVLREACTFQGPITFFFQLALLYKEVHKSFSIQITS